MNGITTVLPPQELAARKRQLHDDLVLIRTQKMEVLRQIQQIAKRQRTSLSAGPLSVEERRLLKREEQRRRMDAIWQTCLKIVQELLKNVSTKTYFGEPVKVDYVPNYYQLIKCPMDLGTIKTKLERRKYTDIYQFRSDMRLVFDNCRIFNPEGNFVRVFGDQASSRFEQKWVQLAVEHTWESEMKRQELEEKQLQADTIPAKLAEVDAELQELTAKATAALAPPSAPGPGRDMTFEEKRRLSHALGQLPGERLSRVLEIIAEGPSAPQLENEEEYELDIDALDADTLWKLQAYVTSVLGDLAAKPPAGSAPAGGAATAGTPGSAAAGGGAPGGQQRQHVTKTEQMGASESEEVGSKGGAESTLGDHPPAGGAAAGGAPSTHQEAAHTPQLLPPPPGKPSPWPDAATASAAADPSPATSPAAPAAAAQPAGGQGASGGVTPAAACLPGQPARAGVQA